ncbi:MAG: hypothetical protein RLZZ182_2274 [Pseudomonadota bacterium]
MRLILCCAAMLVGCANTPTATIPVAVSCVKEVPVKPETRPEAEILALDDYAATMVAWTERLLLKAYSEKADAIIQACR